MLVEELANLSGPSGSEDNIRNFIREHAQADEVYTDNMGNLICHKKGSGKRVMVCAHMDEVALIITGINDDGFLSFRTLGGIETAVLCSKKVYIGEKRVPGIVSAKAVHLQSRDEMTKPLKLKDMYIDIGATDKKDAESMISLGDYAVFDGKFTLFGDNLAKSKALDDRVGCAVLLKLMNEKHFDSDIYYAFTVQEETGLRGAAVAAYGVKPDIALVIEGTTCSDVYGSKEHNSVTTIGGGAAMTAMDRAAISDRNYFDYIIKTADKYNIPLQIKRTTMGGTDAGSIQRSRCGVPTAVLAVPCRYIHSPVSVMSMHDFECTERLAEAVLRDMEGSGI